MRVIKVKNLDKTNLAKLAKKIAKKPLFNLTNIVALEFKRFADWARYHRYRIPAKEVPVFDALVKSSTEVKNPEYEPTEEMMVRNLLRQRGLKPYVYYDREKQQVVYELNRSFM